MVLNQLFKVFQVDFQQWVLRTRHLDYYALDFTRMFFGGPINRSPFHHPVQSTMEDLIVIELQCIPFSGMMACNSWWHLNCYAFELSALNEVLLAILYHYVQHIQFLAVYIILPCNFCIFNLRFASDFCLVSYFCYSIVTLRIGCPSLLLLCNLYNLL